VAAITDTGQDPPETTEEELADEEDGAEAGELSEELEAEEAVLRALARFELDDRCAPVRVGVLEPALVAEDAELWWAPAAAAATPPVRTAAPRAMPRVARRINRRPRARRCRGVRGTDLRSSRIMGAGLR
jgi:hypothetical protein